MEVLWTFIIETGLASNGKNWETAWANRRYSQVHTQSCHTHLSLDKSNSFFPPLSKNIAVLQDVISKTDLVWKYLFCHTVSTRGLIECCFIKITIPWKQRTGQSYSVLGPWTCTAAIWVGILLLLNVKTNLIDG